MNENTTYTYATQILPSPEELQNLFAQTTWAAGRDLESIRSLLLSDPITVTVHLDGRLVGFGRAVTDRVYRALLDDIVVDAAHRGSGLGRTIVRMLLDQLKGVEEIYLNTGNHLEAFYSRCGFRKSDGFTMKIQNSEAR